MKLPKNYHPDFRVPGRKPVGPVEVDWDHPLAKGLSHVLLFQQGRIHDLVTGKSLTKGGDARWIPDGIFFDESGDYLILPDVTLNNDYTIVIHTSFTDNAGALFQYFLSFGAFQTVNSFNWFLGESSGSTANILRVVASSAVGTTNDVNSFWPSQNNKQVAVTVSGSNIQQYVGGVASGVQTGSPGVMANGTVKDLYIGGRSDLNADRFLGGRIGYVFVYGDRALSSAESRRINSNPYQILKPANPIHLPIQVSGGGGPTPVTADLTAQWNLLQAVQSDANLQWSLLNAVQQSADLQWSILNSVQQDADLQWSIIQAVQQDADLQWNILAALSSVQSDLTAQWSILEGVFADSESRWSILNSVFSDSEARWSILNSVLSDADLRWNVLSALSSVSNDLELRWDMSGKVFSSLTAQWNIFNAVTSDADLRWSILNAISQDLSTRWDVVEAVQAGADLRWDIIAATDSTLTLRWNIASETQFPDLEGVITLESKTPVFTVSSLTPKITVH